jgi:hypothetical protein
MRLQDGKCDGPYERSCIAYADDRVNIRLYQWCPSCLAKLSNRLKAEAREAAPLPASAALPTRSEIWDRYEMAAYGKVGNTFEVERRDRLQAFFDWLLAAALRDHDEEP